MLQRLSILLLMVIVACQKPPAEVAELESLTRLPARDLLLEKIAFGSCNHENEEQFMWEAIASQDPDLWIWLGDIVYADSDYPGVIAGAYQMQLENPDYKAFIKDIPVLGIWDDHDYGSNNAGKEFVAREESRDILFDFLNIPEDSPERDHAGAYQSYIIGPQGKRVKIILLDARYFRDPRPKDNSSPEKLASADILGEAQWSWLEKELDPEDAKIFIIGSGIQVLPDGHPYEKWANFPVARQRLLDLVSSKKLPRTIFISGDRHLGEFSVIKLPGLPNPVFEITSSGLTHHYRGTPNENNSYRLGDLVPDHNFGLLSIDWSGEAPKVSGQLRGPEGRIYKAFRFF